MLGTVCIGKAEAHKHPNQYGSQVWGSFVVSTLAPIRDHPFISYSGVHIGGFTVIILKSYVSTNEYDRPVLVNIINNLKTIKPGKN